MVTEAAGIRAVMEAGCVSAAIPARSSQQLSTTRDRGFDDVLQ
ncbi:hypothetical protein A2U01_0089174, partial [Trifolium medium]|nr:hypothetical protein [Trifolium medium]